MMIIAMSGESMGRGDEELGRRLAIKFLHTVSTLADRPHAILFYNTGVRLLLASSPAIEALRTMEQEGVELVACGTCIEHFGLGGQLGAGRVSDMREIVKTLTDASKVVTI